MEPNANVVTTPSPRHPVTGLIQFRANSFLTFITTRPFTLGQSGNQVRAGTEILFDGTKAIVEGTEYPSLPFLRGAVKAGSNPLADSLA